MTQTVVWCVQKVASMDRPTRDSLEQSNEQKLYRQGVRSLKAFSKGLALTPSFAKAQASTNGPELSMNAHKTQRPYNLMNSKH